MEMVKFIIVPTAFRLLRLVKQATTGMINVTLF
jgi:hypothetical protein